MASKEKRSKVHHLAAALRIAPEAESEAEREALRILRVNLGRISGLTKEDLRSTEESFLVTLRNEQKVAAKAEAWIRSGLMTMEDFRALSWEEFHALSSEPGERPCERPGRLFDLAEHALDLLLEPEAAENAIGNLRELYARRRAVKPKFAKCWLFFQFGWIVYGRAMDIYSRFTRARAGK